MKYVHFIGIGGSGTSACAAITKEFGFKISGCDKEPHNEFTSYFKKNELQKGHSPAHLQNVDILAVTPAILSLDPNNPEILEAKKRKIRVMTWQHFMGKFLQKEKFVIAICGTHGKSTTTAMIAQILEDAGLDPTVELGAIIPRWGKNFRVGEGKYFITEADEFNDNYLPTKPDISVVTNVEMDHPEYFKDFLAYKRSFQNFLHQTRKLIIANMEDPGIKESLGEENVRMGSFFKPIVDYSKMLIDFPLQVLGNHNILNASAAYQVGLNLGINPKQIKQSLSNFTSIGRRMEFLGEVHGADVYSDFGHHPTEIKATIQAFKEKFPQKQIILIYQPHMFSRTKVLFNEFVEVFKTLPVEKTHMLDIYPSREIDPGLVSSRQLVKEVGKESTSYESDKKQLVSELINELTNNQILVFMGAGDIDQLARKMIKG